MCFISPSYDYVHKYIRFCLLDSGYDAVQCTLVDCPGHASLIRTIIGGTLLCTYMYISTCFYLFISNKNILQKGPDKKVGSQLLCSVTAQSK